MGLKGLRHFLKIAVMMQCILSCSEGLFAQQTFYKPKTNYNDLQFWQNIYYEKNLSHRINAHFNEEGRITENLTRPSYVYVDFGLTYKPWKFLHLTIAYVPIAKRQLTDFTVYEHQFYFDWVLKLKYGNFIFYDRQMFQSQYNGINRSATWNIPSYYLRQKVTVKYRAGLRYTPYVAAELYYHDNMNTTDGVGRDRMRYFMGVFYRLNTVHEIEFYYMIETHNNIPSPYQNYVLGFGYAYNMF